MYLPKPESWALDPAATERPDWWQGATVMPFWEAKGAPRLIGRLGNRAPKVDINGTEDAQWIWRRGAGQGWGPYLNVLNVATEIGLAGDAEILPSTTRATILLVRIVENTGDVGGGIEFRNTDFTLKTYLPYTNGNAYWDFGGEGAGQRVFWTGYTTSPAINALETWAFRAGRAGLALWFNGAKVASDTSTPSSRTHSTDFEIMNDDDMGWHFFAAIDAEWPDQQIIEWSRDPFVMLRPASRAFIIPALGGPTVILRPNGDDTAGRWTTDAGATTNLYASIDEVAASDVDYIKSDSFPTDSIARVTLENTAETIGGGTGRVSIRYYKADTGTINLTVRLKEGGSTIASWVYNNISGSVVQANETLSSGEVASISNPNDLTLEFEADAV